MKKKSPGLIWIHGMINRKTLPLKSLIPWLNIVLTIIIEVIDYIKQDL